MGGASHLQAKPAWYQAGYPVPYAYSQRFLNMTGGTAPAVWNPEERQFASAVWAQDVMVGAVLDQLQKDGIAKQTLVGPSAPPPTRAHTHMRAQE